MTVYKITEKNMIATRGNGKYKLKMGLNITPNANCARNGFHAAENPLDCFNYYSPSDSNEYYLCKAFGDVDEDARDSKVSCTHLNIKRKLSFEEFIMHAILYIYKNPKAANHSRIVKDKGSTDNGFVIVKGKNPIACGTKKGDVLGYILVNNNEVADVFYHVVDNKEFKPGVYYDFYGEKVKV